MAEAYHPRLELATVRGIACVALVAYHVIGPTSATGMHLPESSKWHFVMNSLDFMRMPMFSVLAGFLYAGRRATTDSLGDFFSKKALRLLAPLLFVTTVTFMLRGMVYGDQTSYLTALLFHYQHLWFLQSLFLIFTVFAVWDALAKPNWVALGVVSFAAVMVSRTFNITSFLSLNGVFYLLPFFATGMALRIRQEVLRSKEAMTISTAIIVIVMTTCLAAAAFGGDQITRLSLPAALCGLSSAYIMLVKCPRIAVFEFIGKYSFTIYLWHSIATSAVRQNIVEQFQLPQFIEFGLLLIAGVAAPIALHRIVRRIPGVSILAAGVRHQKFRAKPRTIGVSAFGETGQIPVLALGERRQLSRRPNFKAIIAHRRDTDSQLAA